MKAYETYVGNRTDYTDETDPMFKQIQELGQEYGATTGRPRKVNWMNLDRVIMAANVNGVTEIIINKADVLQLVGTFSANFDGVRCTFKQYDNFKNFVDAILYEYCGSRIKIIWSLTPNGI
jgi:adenylosuccinate synthase